MARSLRIEFLGAGAIYHTTARGNARQFILVDYTNQEIGRHYAIVSRVLKRKREERQQ